MNKVVTAFLLVLAVTWAAATERGHALPKLGRLPRVEAGADREPDAVEVRLGLMFATVGEQDSVLGDAAERGHRVCPALAVHLREL